MIATAKRDKARLTRDFLRKAVEREISLVEAGQTPLPSFDTASYELDMAEQDLKIAETRLKFLQKGS